MKTVITLETKELVKKRYTNQCNTMRRGDNDGVAKFLSSDIEKIIENKSFEDCEIDRRIVLGVSTLGRESLRYAIDSILKQKSSDGNRLDIDIVISVPQSADKNKILDYLPEIDDFQSKNIIISTVNDFGPITKLMGAINAVESENDIILLADDDVVYPENHFYNLIKNFLFLEERFAVSCSGFRWKGMIKGYENDRMPFESYINVEGHFELVDIIETWCGVCLRASWFNTSFKNFVKNICFVEPELFRQDDMVYSCYLDLQGIRKLNINTDLCNRYDTGFSETSLIACGHNTNTESLNGINGEQMNWVRVAEYIVATQNYIFEFCDTNKTEKRIAVATVSIGDSYTKMMWPGMISKAAYCDKHGYKFIVQSQSLDPKKPLIWSKLILIKKLLSEGYDFILYTDADSIITNKNIKIESFFSIYDKSLLVTNDVNGINIGNILIKNTKASVYFIDLCLSQEGFYYKAPWYEQAAFVYLMNKYPEFANQHIAVTPKNMFNSYVNDWSQNDFIVHLAGIYGQHVPELMRSVYSIATNKKSISLLSNYYELKPYFHDYLPDPNASDNLQPILDCEATDFDLYREINNNYSGRKILIIIGVKIDFIVDIIRECENTIVIEDGCVASITSILSHVSNDVLTVIVLSKVDFSLDQVKDFCGDSGVKLSVALLGYFDQSLDLISAYSNIINHDYFKNISKFFRCEDFHVNTVHAFHEFGNFIGICGFQQIALKYVKNHFDSGISNINSCLGYGSFVACWRSPTLAVWDKPIGLDSLASTEVR